MKDVKRLMFQARGFDLAWGSVANGWMLENSSGLIRTLPNLISGLSELERVSRCPSSDFRVMANPYMT